MIIDEKITVRIGFVGAIVIGAFSFFSVFYETKANSKSIDALYVEQKEEMKLLIEIRERIIKLEEKAK